MYEGMDNSTIRRYVRRHGQNVYFTHESQTSDHFIPAGSYDAPLPRIWPTAAANFFWQLARLPDQAGYRVTVWE